MKQNNVDEHVFIEDIIYCPSQIYYYFTDENDKLWCAYVRQRRGNLTLELVNVDPETLFFDFKNSINVILSRKYDINNQTNPELEEKEIVQLENEIIFFLRQKFTKVSFPLDPPRRIKYLEDLI